MQSVSVIIPTYNHGQFLGKAIESALGQTRPPAEVIIVDDGSHDETDQVLARYGNRVRTLRQLNQGVASARNAGAAMARGAFLTFLDADDAWLPRKLELQMARIVAEPDLGLVHCGVEEIDVNGLPLRRRQDGLEGWVADELLLFRRPVILGGGSGVLTPRHVFETVGGFDRRLSTSADWDLYYRIGSRWKVGFVPEVLLQYRVHGSNMHRNVRAMEHDMLLLLKKAFSDAQLPPTVARRRCYGNLHTTLAGAYFDNRDMRKFIVHASKGLYLTPASARRYLAYPIRWWQRKQGERSSITSPTTVI